MVESVKCSNKECKAFDVEVKVSLYFVGRVAPLDGPWPCVVCGEPMTPARIIYDNYKSGSGKNTPRRISVQHSEKKRRVGKKKPSKGIKIKVASGQVKDVRFKKPPTKSSGRKSAPRKRI